MAESVQPIPAGYHTLTPYLIIREAARALDFYKQAFGADECCRLSAPDGKVGHAEMRIGDSIFMLADESPEWGSRSPELLGGTAVSLVLYVENVDAVFQRAIDAGAKVLRPLEDKFYGDRMGTLLDPFGHEWSLATHIEDVSPEEMERRVAVAFAKPA